MQNEANKVLDPSVAEDKGEFSYAGMSSRTPSKSPVREEAPKPPVRADRNQVLKMVEEEANKSKKINKAMNELSN